MASTILITKLFIPAIRPDLVRRPKLVERLVAGLDQGDRFSRKLTLISAPAGFGKTTLVSQWLNAMEGLPGSARIAWLSLDEGDNDLTRFLQYLLAALNRMDTRGDAFGKGVLGMLQSPQPPDTSMVLTPLINEIAAYPEKLIFILDDFHVIEAQTVHDAVGFLIENLPPRMHLVISTREDPLLPLSRLRARGQLLELRAADLRFTNAETTEFLKRVMSLKLSVEDIAALETRTEGWVAGLQLAAISLQGQTDTSKLIRAFTGSNRLVLDYLIEEVLSQQPEFLQQFLLQTSILERLNAPLCDALTRQKDSQSILEMLDRANLFIVPLDNERLWYRYHHLFADLLEQRLKKTQPENIPGLHRRASLWYQQNDLPSNAIRHSLVVKDFERAAGLAELAWPAWSGSYQSIAWLGWLNDLPEEIVRNRPVLSLAFAWAYLNAGKLEEADAKMKDVECLLASRESADQKQAVSSAEMVVVDGGQFQALPCSLAMARAYHAQAVGDINGTEKFVEQALDLLPEDDFYNRAAVTGLLGLAYWADGKLETAHKTFSDGLFQNDHDQIQGTFVLADMMMTLGLLREAEKKCEIGLNLASGFDPPNPIGTEDVYSGLSQIHREQGNLEAAELDLTYAKKLGEQVALPDWKYRWCIAKSQLLDSMGNLQEAIDLLEEAERVFVRTPLPNVRPIHAMKARLMIKQGRQREVLIWARQQGLSVNDELNYMREYEHITLTRLLIAQYKQDRMGASIEDALELLKRLLAAAETGGRKGSMIEILILQGLAYQVKGNIPAALVSLERAMRLAVLEGYVRIFVDEGPPMARLLYEALSQGIASDYARQLLAAFPEVEPEQTAVPQLHTSEMDGIEPLSDREVEVLQLIAEGLTNLEIATRLYLSLNTVKAHTRNIYAKLGVNNRTQAGIRARALGVISST